MMDKQKTIDGLLDWMHHTLPQDNGLLLPISGGSDSALCFWLCNQDFGKLTKGIFIGTQLRCKEWFMPVGDVMFSEIANDGKNPEVQRWAHFLGVALNENRVLIGSRNFTETTLGTFSNASRVAAFLPLAGLWKSEVMELCEYVGIPDEILESSRRADPECGRPEKLADIPFEAVDVFLQSKLGISSNNQEYEPTQEQYEYLEKVFTQNAYKSRLPLTGPAAVR